MSDDIRRIGRRLRPGESTVALIREHPEKLDYIAMRLWLPISGHERHTTDAQAEWDAMSENDREVWRDRAFARLCEDCNASDATRGPRDDDPGGGGQPLPIERIA